VKGCRPGIVPARAKPQVSAARLRPVAKPDSAHVKGCRPGIVPARAKPQVSAARLRPVAKPDSAKLNWGE
jgi:hypothetical protein